jgi:hypothetical protein
MATSRSWRARISLATFGIQPFAGTFIHSDFHSFPDYTMNGSSRLCSND